MHPKNMLPYMRRYITQMTFGLLLSFSVDAIAQQTDSKSLENEKGKEEKKEEIIELTPFTVEGQVARGYSQGTTLSGSRSVANLLDIPQSINIVTSDFIRDLGTSNNTTALMFGVSGIARREFGKDDVQVRGFRSGLFLLDGVATRFTRGTTNYEIDRIEVVKGPAALVYGGGATPGGIVNIATKRPTGTPFSELSLSLGSNNHWSAAATISGPVREDIGYRVTVGTTSAESDVHGFYSKDKHVSTLWTFKLGSRHMLDAYLGYTEKDFIVPWTVIINGQPGGVENFTYWEDYNSDVNKMVRSALTLKSAILDNLNVSTNVSFSWFDQKRNESWQWSFLAPDVIERRHIRFSNNIGVVSAQIDATLVNQIAGGRNTLSFGTQAFRATDTQKLDYYSLAPMNINAPVYGSRPGAFISTNGYRSSSPNTFEAYLQDHIKLWKDKVILSAGTRWNEIDSNSPVRVDRYGLAVRPVESVSIFGGYSESFVKAIGLDVYDNPFIPELAKQYEVGIKFSPASSRVFASLVYFDIENTNQRVSIQLPSGRTGPVQIGKVKSTGVEFDLQGRILDTKTGTLDAIATYFSGKQRDVKGLRILLSPEETYSFWLKYTLEMQGDNKAFVGFGAYHAGDRRGNSYFAADYTVANALVGYTTKKWSLRLNVENLADKYYVDDAVFQNYAVAGKRRTYIMNFDYRF